MPDPTTQSRGSRMLNEFFRLEAAGGIVLFAAAVLAMVAANFLFADLYGAFRDLPMQVRVGELDTAKPLMT